MSRDAKTANPWMLGITRAMNLTLPEQDVINRCHDRKIRISAIEPLNDRETHLVCETIEGADEARLVFKNAIITGPVRRTMFQRIDSKRLR